MSRITKLVAAAALLAVPLIQACGEDPIPPPATGTIMGTVAIEGDGADGVTVTLSSGVTATTANGGTFSFTDVEVGTYTVTISNHPEDASFPQTSAPATLSEDGETVTVNFNGSYIRTSAIMGTVMVEDEGLSNVTVKITGMSESETLTGATGQYAFTGLRAGNYTIEISGFDTDDIAFGATSSTAQVTVGESKVVSFDGTYLRASGVSGQVSVEGVGLAGVTVSLQGRGEDFTERTNAAGQFMFDKLRKGEYAVAISGYDDDEYGFDVTSKTVTVARGETGNVPFEGIALRTAGIKGTVSVAGHGPLDGVTVSLSGKGEDMAVVTNAAGQWSFDRLHAGDYSVAITGYDKDEFGFDVTSENVTVALKETATVEFEGILLRTAAIEGEVTVKGDALAGVTVTVSGGPKDEEFEETTNGAGMYEVGDLHAGDYSVTISGYDTDEYGFEVTTKSVSVGLRETAEVAFDGILLRTAGVSGRVTIDGDAMSGLTVKLAGEEDRSGMTDGNGQYAFSGLAAGDYTLTLSGYDTDEYEFDPSMMDIELELDEAAIHNFMGRSLRTVVIMGTVSAEGDALMNVGVTLIKVLGATTGEVLGATMTDEDGGYMFDELLAGVYRVDLGETDDEYDFATKTRQGAVATDETAMWDFDADIIRTASVGGEVTLDGDPMGEVMVMLTGDHDTDKEMETGSDGMYMFDGLRKGSYTVSIENPDEDTYDFPTTSRSVSLSVGQEQDDISFAGSMLRRASISGQVHVEGDGLEGVAVTLDGDAEDETMTDANGEYNFPGLAGGDYKIEIENPDDDAYIFEVMEMDVDDLGDEEARIVDFAGEHTTTASVSGMLFADEIEVDSMHTEGEPVLAAAAFDSFPLLLRGPGVNDVRAGFTDTTGMYSFDGLKAGTYNVVVNLTDEIKAALARAGYRFSGEVTTFGIEVPAATDVDLDLPFRITKQTIYAGALLATNARASFPVGGVSMALYPTAEDAEDGTNSLGAATTRSGKADDPMTGLAKFEFERARDKGPGGGGIDYLVYAKVTRVSNSDLKVHNDAVIEIEYEAVDRESHAPTVAKLINTRVNFQWWVKSNETAKDGDRALGGWMASNGSATNSKGLATYTGTLSAAQMAAAIRGTAARFTVAMNTTQADSVDMNEKWTQSRSLSHTHTGLENPATNTMAANDLGPVYITWQTHSLVLGVYRETDDVEGYTNYQSRVPGGDHRPASSVARRMKLEFLEEDDRGRDKPYKYDHDACWNKNSHKTDEREVIASFGSDGLATVSCLPRNDEFTIKFTPDTASAPNRAEVGIVAEKLHGYLEPYNAKDMSVSGSTVGTFGDGSGGVPEVRICLSSKGTKDDECATWGYQWETGSVIGAVRQGGNRVSGHRIFIEPVTDEHGADTTSTRSSSSRDYKLDDLRDGVYEITAYSTRTHKIRGDSVHEVVFYHDEKTDDKDTLTKYVGTAAQDTANWSVQRLGLKLMGYIGNDVNGDSRFRGDESNAGISVRLSGGGLSMSTTTNERGFYEFEDLPEGRYTITPSSSTYLVNRGYRTLSSGAKIPYTNWSVSAQTYPSLIEEGDVRLPRVSLTSRSVSNSSSRVCDDRTPPTCGTFYNFGMLYRDGEVEGAVNNLSGSASGIDLIWTDVFLGDRSKQEITTNFRGEFTRTRLTEGTYTMKLEDAGWEVARMNFSGKADDDGTRSQTYPVRASLSGKDDFEQMALHVYDAGASSADYAGSSVRVSGRWQGTTAQNFDSTISWPTGWSRASGTEKTAGGNIGTISWKSASVSFYFGFRNSALSRDASVEVMKGSTVCSFHRCTLDYNRTNSTRGEGEGRENTLTVMVTAENGYDDHEYTLKVSRAAPVGDELTRERFRRVDVVDDDTTETPALGDGDGKTVSRAFEMETKNATGSSMNMRIDLVELGVRGEENEYCAQRVVTVKELNKDDDDALKALNPSDDEDKYKDDVCRDTRYRLGVDKSYEIEIESEDSVSETYYLNTRNRDRSGDAELESLEIDGDAISLVSGDTTYSAVEAAEQVTVEWETADENARVLATPRDAESDEDGHQFDLGDPNKVDTLTIRVISEDSKDTAHYVLDIRRANNVATLATLSPDVDLNENFDPGTTAYTADADHDDDEVVFTFTTTDKAATTDPASGHSAELGDPGSDTDVEITVTAEDGSTTETYTVTVTKADEPPDAVPAILFVQKDKMVESVMVGEGDSLVYGVRLEKEPASDVVVTLPTYETEDFTRASGVATSFTFTSSNYDEPQYDTLVSVEDDDGADDEVNGLFVTDDAASDDDYDDVEATIEITTDDDDTPGITMTPLGMEFVEGATTRNTYEITLDTRPTATVLIGPDKSDLPEGVTVTPPEWTVSPNGSAWSDGQEFTLTATDDTDEDNNDLSISLSHSVQSLGDYSGMTVPDLDALVHATEEASVIISVTRTEMDEGGEFTYAVSLAMAPESGETVTVTIDCKTSDFSSGCKDGDGDPVELEFTATTEQTVTLTANQVNPDRDVVVRHTVSSDDDDGEYADVTAASSINVKIVDRDGS